MAAPKTKSAFEREQFLARVAELRVRGWTQQRIADELGVSKSQVCKDLKIIEQEWRESRALSELQTLRNDTPIRPRKVFNWSDDMATVIPLDKYPNLKDVLRPLNSIGLAIDHVEKAQNAKPVKHARTKGVAERRGKTTRGSK